MMGFNPGNFGEDATFLVKKKEVEMVNDLGI